MKVGDLVTCTDRNYVWYYELEGHVGHVIQQERLEGTQEPNGWWVFFPTAVGDAGDGWRWLNEGQLAVFSSAPIRS